MNETHRQHARPRAAGANDEAAPPKRNQNEEGPAATFERTRPDPPLTDEQANAADGNTQAGGEVREVGADMGVSPPAADDAPVTPREDDVEARLEAEKAKAEEYLEQWRRAAADFSNYKRRIEQERGEMAKLFNEGLVKALLPVLDNFERALASMPAELKSHSWVEGVSLTEKQLRGALEKEGLATIEALGQKFDPNLHEAVAHDVSDDHEEDSVIEEFQKGYKLHDRVIRPSMVKVSRRS